MLPIEVEDVFPTNQLHVVSLYIGEKPELLSLEQQKRVVHFLPEYGEDSMLGLTKWNILTRHCIDCYGTSSSVLIIFGWTVSSALNLFYY